MSLEDGKGRGDCFTNGKPRIATEKDCGTRWNGGRPGEAFRCGLCGYKFQVGDYWRWQFTNDAPGTAGNIFVCKECDTGRDSIIEKYQALYAEFMSDKFWAFRD